MLNKYPNLRTPLSSFVNQRNMHTTLPRQILKILGFFSEPQQAPISFVPATLQTADATSSLPGATLMWVRCCSTNRMHIQIFVDSSDMGLWNGAWTLRHAAILWWQVAISEVHKEMSTTKRYWLEQPRWLFRVMSGDCALGLDSMNWSPSKLYSSCTIMAKCPIVEVWESLDCRPRQSKRTELRLFTGT